MKELQIERNMDNRKFTATLTDDELEKAYRIMERRYLDEDFANALADAAQDPDTRFHSGHLEEFPELSDWLCEYYDAIYDANMGHNDLLELALGHLHEASLEPQFFSSLSRTAPAVCMGIEKNVEDCEQGCGRYYHCSNIAEAEDRSRQWETLASLITMHNSGSCTCSKDDGDGKCPAAKYLKGIWDISEFFHLENRTETAELPDVCINTAILYAPPGKRKEGPDSSESLRLSGWNSIQADGITLKKDMAEVSLKDGPAMSAHDFAWELMHRAYLSLANYCSVNLELEADVTGNGIYIDTDTDESYLTRSYKVRLSGQLAASFLDALHGTEQEYANFHPDPAAGLLWRFWEDNFIVADSTETLQLALAHNCRAIYEPSKPILTGGNENGTL